VNPHLRQANCQFANFRFSECDRVVQVAFRAGMASDLMSDVCARLVEDHPFLCNFSVLGDPMLCHFGNDDSGLCASDES